MTRSKRARRLARRAYAEKHPAPVVKASEQTAIAAAPKRAVKQKPRKPLFARQEFVYALSTVATIVAVSLLVYWLWGRDKAATGGQTIAAPANPTVAAKQYAAPPAMAIDQNRTYIATLETDKGIVKAELFAKDAPKTVNNFVFLARQGFYDGLTFHRVLAGFMAQGGDPTGTGAGGPGYQFEDEFSQRKHLIGSLSMANSGPNTNGSQFFITYAPQPHLDGRHSVFGQVIEGMDVLQKLTPRDPDTRPAFTGDQVKKITIEEK